MIRRKCWCILGSPILIMSSKSQHVMWCQHGMWVLCGKWCHRITITLFAFLDFTRGDMGLMLSVVCFLYCLVHPSPSWCPLELLVDWNPSLPKWNTNCMLVFLNITFSSNVFFSLKIIVIFAHLSRCVANYTQTSLSLFSLTFYSSSNLIFVVHQSLFN